MFVAEDESFQVEFPGVPNVQETKTPGGRDMLAFTVDVGRTEYMANYVVTPSLVERSRVAQEALLKEIADRQPRDSITPMEVNGHPAIEFETISAGKRRFHRMCLVGTRTYEYMVTGDRDGYDVQAAKRFLDSFDVTTPAEPDASNLE